MDDRKGPAWFLGPDGPVAAGLGGYESRTEQIELARAVDLAFEQSHHLIAEAGTGIGKSFAYLVPAIQHAIESKEKVVVSTHTIALQEQLIRKDVPFIKKMSGWEFNCTLAKGRRNYLCWRRLEQARKKAVTLFPSADEINQIEDLYHWALQTADGSLSNLENQPATDIWDSVCSDTACCFGRNCDRHNVCFYQTARRKMFGADMIVANHAMLFSDLALRANGANILPKFKRVILDEAHNIENVAGKHFGLRITNYQVRFILNRLYNAKTGKGILAGCADDKIFETLVRLTKSNDVFFKEALNFYDAEQLAGRNGRIDSADALANLLAEPLMKLSRELAELSKSREDEQEKIELTSNAVRCSELGCGFETFIRQSLPESVYWLEAARRRREPRIELHCAPLNVGKTLKKVLFDECSTVILTSATLSTKTIDRRKTDTETKNKKTDGFEFLCSRIGLEDFQGLQLGSPFDYSRQVKMYIEAHLPEPTPTAANFLTEASEATKKYLRQTHGKAFILCTSFSQLRQMGELLEEFCDENQITLLQQGAGADRSQLLEEFRRDIDSILLGTDSFWQGVDVQGASLSNVIITKLPFSVPNHPLLQARLEQIKQNGESPFSAYQLPEAILKLKQGFGRLIRSKTDTGIVVILDPRVVTKRYGRVFLRALPNCPTEIVDRP